MSGAASAKAWEREEVSVWDRQRWGREGGSDRGRLGQGLWHSQGPVPLGVQWEAIGVDAARSCL